MCNPFYLAFKNAAEARGQPFRNLGAWSVAS